MEDDLIDLEEFTDDELREFMLARWCDFLAAQEELAKRGGHSI